MSQAEKESERLYVSIDICSVCIYVRMYVNIYSTHTHSLT